MSIVNYEKNKRTPQVEVVKKIAEALEIPPNYLIFGVEKSLERFENSLDYESTLKTAFKTYSNNLGYAIQPTGKRDSFSMFPMYDRSITSFSDEEIKQGEFKNRKKIRSEKDWESINNPEICISFTTEEYYNLHKELACYFEYLLYRQKIKNNKNND
jgi:transcriptional regulator with XRE-family HTH domain